MTDSPSTVGSVATRMSSIRPAAAASERDAAVLRLAPLGDVELREHLEARRHAGGEPLRHAVSDVQHTVDAVADDQLVLLRLDMDVGRSVLGRLEDHRVDEAHERGIGDPVVGLEVVLIVFVPDDDRSGTSSCSSPRPRARAGAARSGRRCGPRRGTDVEARRKLQLVETAHVLRIRDRDLDRRAVARERDRAHALEDRQRRSSFAALASTPAIARSTSGRWYCSARRARDTERSSRSLPRRAPATNDDPPADTTHDVDLLGGEQARRADHVGDEVAWPSAAPPTSSVSSLDAEQTHGRRRPR